MFALILAASILYYKKLHYTCTCKFTKYGARMLTKKAQKLCFARNLEKTRKTDRTKLFGEVLASCQRMFFWCSMSFFGFLGLES